MPSSLDTPLTKEAAQLLERLRPKIQAGLSEVNRVPTSVLVWGSGVDSDGPLKEVRYRLRSKLRENGHAAAFSEELMDPHSSHSIRLQQLIQAQEFDLVVSIPGTSGSIGEVHDFAADRRVHAKLLIFINTQHASGYSSQSLEAVSTLLSCEIVYYPDETETTIIEERTLVEAQKIREMKYLLAGRY